MKNTILLCAAGLLGSVNALAAEVEVQWQDLEKFTDIRPASDSRKAYRERVMKKFEGFFQELSANLPEGYTWQVTVSDIDLAGDVDYFAGGAGNPLRVVKEIYSPAIKFSHVLRDKYGEQVVGGEEKLRDMGFMHSLRSVSKNDEFHYEKQMLEDWFNKKLQPQLQQHAKALPKVSEG